MKIKLFKKCILNNSYSEVFNTKDGADGKSALVSYLDTLDNFEYDDDFIYTTGSGVFNMELYPEMDDASIYEYNYMLLQDFDESGTVVFERYCFIDNIVKVSASVVEVTYSEDVWSNYSKSMTIRDGVICNKLRDPATPYYLPARYDGNNVLGWKEISDGKGKFYIIATVQYYTTVKEGEVSGRSIAQVVLGLAGENTPHMFDDMQAINLLVETQAKENAFHFLGNEYSYQIDNFILVPFTTMRVGDKTYSFDVEYVSSAGSATITGYSLPTVTNYRFELQRVQLQNDFQAIAIGSYFHSYEFTPNGTNIEVDFELAVSEYEVKVTMGYQNKRIDITDDLRVNVPISSITSEANMQRRIAREVQNIRGITDTVSGVVKVGTEIAGAVMSGGVSLLGGSTSEVAGSINYRYSGIDRQVTSERYTQNRKTANEPSVGGLLSGVVQIVNGVTTLVYANKPVYTSNQGTFATSEAYINARNGLAYFYVIPDNKDYVDKLLKRMGYTVFMPVEDYELTGDKYDFIRFQSVILYGNFPQVVQSALTNILRNGIRIFYTKDITI